MTEETRHPGGGPAPEKHRGLKAPWKPGQSGNPKGRGKGSRNKLGEAFLEALHDDFNDHGKDAIIKCRQEKPEAYLKVIAGLLPRDVNLNVNRFDEAGDDELIERIRQLDAAIGPFLAAQGEDGNSGGTEAEIRH